MPRVSGSFERRAVLDTYADRAPQPSSARNKNGTTTVSKNVLGMRSPMLRASHDGSPEAVERDLAKLRAANVRASVTVASLCAALLVLAGGVVLAVELYSSTISNAAELSHERFTNDAGEFALTFASVIGTLRGVVDTGTSAMEVQGGNMTREQFFYLARDGMLGVPYIHAYSYIRFVHGDDERATAEAEARESFAALADAGLANGTDVPGGLGNLQFTGGGGVPRELLGASHDYFPVYYIEPLAGNAAAVLFDLGWSSTRLAAIQQVIATRKCVTTEWITLIQETGEQFGVLHFCPLRMDLTVAAEVDAGGGADPSSNSPSDGGDSDVSVQGSGFFGLTSTVLKLGDLLGSVLSQASHTPDVRVCLVDATRDDVEPVVLHCMRQLRDDEVSDGAGDDGSSGAVMESWPGLGMTAEQRTLALSDGDTTSGHLAVEKAFEFSSRKWILRMIPVGNSSADSSQTPVIILTSNLVLVSVISVSVFVAMRKADLDRARNEHHRTLAESVAAAKTSFLRFVFHETRVPFNALTLGISTLVMDEDERASNSDMALTPEERREVFEAVQLSAAQTAKILNETLALEKMKDGKFELSKAPLNLKEVVDQVIGCFMGAARSEGIKLTSYMAPEVAALPLVMADEKVLRHALQNFVSNSIKFSDAEPGAARIAVRLTLVGWDTRGQRRRSYSLQGRSGGKAQRQARFADETDATGGDYIKVRSKGSLFESKSQGGETTAPLRGIASGAPANGVPVAATGALGDGDAGKAAGAIERVKSSYLSAHTDTIPDPSECPFDDADVCEVVVGVDGGDDSDGGDTGLCSLLCCCGPQGSHGSVVRVASPTGEPFTPPDAVTPMGDRARGKGSDNFVHSTSRDPSGSGRRRGGRRWSAAARVRFSVADNGVGIEEDQIHKLFTPFTQVRSGKETIGTGLGLSLLRHEVLKHNGLLGVRSVHREGSEFFFEIPLELAPQQRLSTGSAAIAADTAADPGAARTTGARAKSAPQADTDFERALGMSSSPQAAPGPSPRHTPGATGLGFLGTTPRSSFRVPHRMGSGSGALLPAIDTEATRWARVPGQHTSSPTALSPLAQHAADAAALSRAASTSSGAVSDTDESGTARHGSATSPAVTGGAATGGVATQRPAGVGGGAATLASRSRAATGTSVLSPTGTPKRQNSDQTMLRRALEVSEAEQELAMDYSGARSLTELAPEAMAQLRASLQVLAVDDDRPTRRLMSFLFRKMQIAHDMAADGAQAVEVYARLTGNEVDMPTTSTPGCVDVATFDASRVTLVVMDRTMPIMDGTVAVRHMRRMGVKVPVIALTGNALPSEQEQFIRAGANAVLSKPFSIDAFQQTLVDFVVAGLLPGRFTADGSEFLAASEDDVPVLPEPPGA